MKRTIAFFGVIALALAPSTGFAQSKPTSGSISPAHDTGQPDQSCEEIPNQPGNSGSADNTGSAFSPNGQSGTVYAGEQAGINDKNTASVSQYDVACEKNQSHAH